ncbi:hypothetical protein FDG2_2410 [Candidatus Protofrankia californiensis]|uniref:Uncharacterized protein n=1 Tax=Candidatus Protofrankia californiensis TaxID=1839754 RepID=A0A1C3NXK5_9ACTN|nr:hypothetical protein FDG2_2410 [Candidatus Protofrankia californiensis]
MTEYIHTVNRMCQTFAVHEYLAVDDELPTVAGRPCRNLSYDEPAPGTHVVVAVTDVGLRRKVIEDYVLRYRLPAPNIIHPDAKVETCSIHGQGNIIGPWSYFGAGTALDSFNVVHYHCSFGHHSRVGVNNFFSPNFHCGNSVVIGDDNLFGLSCAVAPHVVVGRSCSFQAGLCLFEDPESRASYFLPNRMKSMKSLEGIQ